MESILWVGICILLIAIGVLDGGRGHCDPPPPKKNNNKMLPMYHILAKFGQYSGKTFFFFPSINSKVSVNGKFYAMGPGNTWSQSCGLSIM